MSPPSPFLPSVDVKALLKLIQGLTINFKSALLASRRTQEINCSASCCLSSHRYALAEERAEQVEIFTRTAKNEKLMEKFFVGNSSGICCYLIVGKVVPFSYTNSVVARYRGEVPSPREDNLTARSLSSDYYGVFDGKAKYSLAHLSTAEELIEHTVLKKKLTDQEEVYGQIGASGPMSVINVAGFALWRVLAVVGGETFYRNASRRPAERSKLRITDDQVVIQPCINTLMCKTLRSLA